MCLLCDCTSTPAQKTKCGFTVLIMMTKWLAVDYRDDCMRGAHKTGTTKMFRTSRPARHLIESTHRFLGDSV